MTTSTILFIAGLSMMPIWGLMLRLLYVLDKNKSKK